MVGQKWVSWRSAAAWNVLAWTWARPGARNDVLAELPEPAAQFARRPGRERDGQHPVRPDDAGRGRVSDPVRDGPGLAGAGAGEHADRPAHRERYLPLLGVQGREHGLWPASAVSVLAHNPPPNLAPIPRAILPYATDVP